MKEPIREEVRFPWVPVPSNKGRPDQRLALTASCPEHPRFLQRLLVSLLSLPHLAADGHCQLRGRRAC